MVFVPGGLVFNNGPFTMTHEGLKDLGKDKKKKKAYKRCNMRSY